MNQKNKINGWINLDKPYGMSSAHAVGRVKKILKPVKIGHAGTLDPLATGVLPLALGEATKTAQYMMDTEKSYIFTIKFGEKTNTDDIEGEIVETSELMPSRVDIENIIPEFTGEIEQIPPEFSAIKINGERAYKKARNGEDVKIPPRIVVINNLNIIDVDELMKKSTFKVDCKKGTYIRSLGRDIAERLGSVGHISMLRRVRVGMHNEKNIFSLENLEKIMHNAPALEGVEDFLLRNDVISRPEAVLDDIPAVRANKAQSIKLRNGQPLLASSFGGYPEEVFPLSGDVMMSPDQELQKNNAALVKVICRNQMVALAELCGRRLLPVRVFNP